MAAVPAKKTPETSTAIATTESPGSRFSLAILKEVKALSGAEVSFSPEQKRLAQHLFARIDETLKVLEFKRGSNPNKGSQPEIAWQNIDMQKLALDSLHRIELGLDALIDNHISPIPYLDGRTGKYKLDLRIGYIGKDYYKRRFALKPPKNVTYELVFSTDKFVPKKKSFDNPVESYTLEVDNPWDRGEIVGGFAYLEYEDPKDNQLILVPEKEFKRSESMGNRDFWTKNPTEMRFKTIVNRAMAKVYPDPEKVPEAYKIVEAEYEADDEGEAKAAIEQGMKQAPPVQIPQAKPLASFDPETGIMSVPVETYGLGKGEQAPFLQ